MKIGVHTDVKVNIELLAKDLYNIHLQYDKAAPLAFGMLDAGIMQCFEENFFTQIKILCANEYPSALDIDAPNVRKFCEDWTADLDDQVKTYTQIVTKEVTVGVYQIAKKNKLLLV